MNPLGRVFIRPSELGEKRRKKRKRPIGVKELIRRNELAQDLWTGMPLKGEDLKEWHRLQDELRIAEEYRDKRGSNKSDEDK